MATKNEPTKSLPPKSARGLIALIVLGVAALVLYMAGKIMGGGY